MCGILGTTDTEAFDGIERINSLIMHRGPDDSGVHIDKDASVALAMRRLSILDLDNGSQPMTSVDGSVSIVYNGEIYNSPQLRKELEDKGFQFRTKNSDTEVLLNLYLHKGTEMLDSVNGMFAFVIHDRKLNILFGARDRVGIKPFYYSHKNGKFAFASEVKCLLAFPWISRDIDPESSFHYLSLQFIPAPGTIFKDIKKLPAGHYFILDLATRSLDKYEYWNLEVSETVPKSVNEWRDIARSSIKSAISRWTLSDVPIACSLSGGLDSSALVGFLARSGATDIRTFSLGFEGSDEQDCNELPLAAKVAEKWGYQHTEVTLNPERVIDDLPAMVRHLDEPYGGGLPSWYIYELVGRHCKVCLTGTGGDELFGNYGKFFIHESGMINRLKHLKRYLRISSSPMDIVNFIRYPHGFHFHRYLTDAAKNSMLLETPFTGLSTEALIEKTWSDAATDSPRNACAYIDFKMQLPEEFLLVTDRFSMAHSVEARTPFLDHELIETVFQMPPDMRTGWNDPKSFYRELVRDVIPEELFTAPKKGFVFPLSSWTRNELKPLIMDLLSPSYLKTQHMFSDRLHHRMIIPHMKGEADFTHQIWTLLMYQLWYREFVENNS